MGPTTMITETKQRQQGQVGQNQFRVAKRVTMMMLHLSTITVISLIIFQIMLLRRSSSSSIEPRFLSTESSLLSFLQESVYTTNDEEDHRASKLPLPALSSLRKSLASSSSASSLKPLSSLLSSNSTISPRAWGYWTDFKSDIQRPSFPCFNPGDKLPFRNMTKSNSNNSVTIIDKPFPLKEKAFYIRDAFAPSVRPTRGLLFVKPMKVGGSTATGVNLRISRNAAQRQNKTYPMCENSYDHARGSLFRRRHIWDSFLWTILREPTDRAISYFFHHAVSRKNIKPNAANFQQTLSKLSHYYLKVHALNDLDSYKQGDNTSSKKKNKKPSTRLTADSFKAAAQDIIRDYQFIGIQERFDESLVVLKFLLNTPLGDMLYIPSKINGNVDEYCHYIQPRKLSPEMNEYLNSTDWQNRIRWDNALYVAANQSLDLTIDTIIGRETVQATVKTFQSALELVQERCSSVMKPPCSSSVSTSSSSSSSTTTTTTPTPTPKIAQERTTVNKREPEETNCLFLDSACAYECIDEVSRELGLDT